MSLDLFLLYKYMLDGQHAVEWCKQNYGFVDIVLKHQRMCRVRLTLYDNNTKKKYDDIHKKRYKNRSI